jgi:hypothetical protein
MSQSNWSVDAYGVREQELAGIDSNAVVKKFKTLHPDEEIEVQLPTVKTVGLRTE